MISSCRLLVEHTQDDSIVKLHDRRHAASHGNLHDGVCHCLLMMMIVGSKWIENDLEEVDLVNRKIWDTLESGLFFSHIQTCAWLMWHVMRILTHYMMTSRVFESIQSQLLVVRLWLIYARSLGRPHWMIARHHIDPTTINCQLHKKANI